MDAELVSMTVNILLKKVKIQYFGATRVRQVLLGTLIKMPVLYLTKLIISEYTEASEEEKINANVITLSSVFWATSKCGI